MLVGSVETTYILRILYWWKRVNNIHFIYLNILFLDFFVMILSLHWFTFFTGKKLVSHLWKLTITWLLNIHNKNMQRICQISK